MSPSTGAAPHSLGVVRQGPEEVEDEPASGVKVSMLSARHE
jgi:hypothetical protein